MKSSVFGLLSETSIHPGSGQDGGLVDQPVAREATTDYPVVYGSAYKGAIRDRFFWENFKHTGNVEDDRDAANEATNPMFGKNDTAGSLLFADVRLLMLPMRSLTSSYYWISCPHLIERAGRDLKRAGVDDGNFNYQIANPPSRGYLGLREQHGQIFLEERQFDRTGDLPEGLADFISSFIAHPSTQQRVSQRLVVLNDDDFNWFAKYGLPVVARNSLDEITKTSKNLWYEETIPPDSLFYSLVGERNPGKRKELEENLKENPYVQVGGNETIGQGWFICQPMATTEVAGAAGGEA